MMETSNGCCCHSNPCGRYKVCSLGSVLPHGCSTLPSSLARPHDEKDEMIRNFSLMLLAIVVASNSWVSRSFSKQPHEILDSVGIDPHMGAVLPVDADFRDSDGNPVVLGDLLNKRPVVLCLVYFDCPMLCKLAADGLVRTVAGLPETVGQDFDVVLVSFNPDDTPARADAARRHALDNYGRAGTDAGWHFLTGSQESIDALTKTVGFNYAWDEASQQFAHASGLMIISPSGSITEYLDGVQFSPRELISAVDRAGKNQVSATPSTSFVRCYLYDPTTGKFGAAVQWTVRGLGLLTVVGLGLMIVRLSCSEPRRAVDAHAIDEGIR